MFARRPRSFFACCLVLCLASCTDAGRVDEACSANAECAPSEYCAQGFCGDTALGSCELRPESCEGTSISIVCGCDGFTYPNKCLANQAGVILAQTGGCACEQNSDCAADQFCALDDSCENPGDCLSPDTCDEEQTDPVCGCDGMTYPDECKAFEAGVRVSAIGECDCKTNDGCAPSDYCAAITCDGPGVCESRDGPCDSETPVEGCDGDVYPSECDAIAAGVRVRPDS